MISKASYGKIVESEESGFRRVISKASKGRIGRIGQSENDFKSTLR